MTVVVLQSNYLPWKGYFDLIQSADRFVFYDEVQYTKNDWRNRNRIYPRNGLHWLTIPIRRDAVKLRISEVPLPDPRWQKDHFKTLLQSYRTAAHFDQIEPLLRETYVDREWDRLSRLNRHLVERISRMIGIDTEFLDSNDFTLSGDRVSRLVNLLKQVGATQYLSGPSAADYLAGTEHLFAEAGIELRFMAYTGYPVYKQFREPFEHAVSIVDLLAHVPPSLRRRFITSTPIDTRSASRTDTDTHTHTQRRADPDDEDTVQ